MTQQDPFENYKKRREVELMENEFQEGASRKRELIEDLLNESGEIAELEERVTDEMQDFLADSTRTAEKMLEKIAEEGPKGKAEEELKHDLQSFIADAQAPEADPPADSGPPSAAPPPQTPAAEPADQKFDLRAALQKIRKGGGNTPDLPPLAGTPGAAAAVVDESARSREEILDSFDATYNQVSNLLNRKLDEPAGDAAGALPALGDTTRPEAPPAAPTASVASTAPPSVAPASPPSVAPASPPSAAPAPTTDPLADPFGGGAEGGGMASTNAFTAEPHEDRDIDDPVPGEEPEGWDLPERKPPPGAWVVAKQKEEGEAGMAGMAGDTYLLKKLSQEVRRLNRVYLVLLEKAVVTRAEVEGPGADGSKITVDSGSAPKSDADDDEDDAVGVDDYDEERYRPILTNENDFSLSTLVKDVHRLKTLRTVLLKKGVVSEKEMAKAK
ncbi:MAG: hypothetical protein ABFS86_16940 [Planctomycetota bacterium]